MNCVSLRHEVLSGLLENWECRQLEAARTTFALTTTSLLPNNDCIEVVVEDLGDSYRVHDSSAVYEFLWTYGIDLLDVSQNARKEHVQDMLSSFQATFLLKKAEITKEVDKGDLWKGVQEIIEVTQRAAGIVLQVRPSPARNFNDRVAGLLISRGANVEQNYPATGYTQKNRFDIRLNGSHEVLIRTISSEYASRVQAKIERAWFAFNDLLEVNRVFSPAVIYDDSEPERAAAWKGKHFRVLDKHSIAAYGFEENRDQLISLANHH